MTSPSPQLSNVAFLSLFRLLLGRLLEPPEEESQAGSELPGARPWLTGNACQGHRHGEWGLGQSILVSLRLLVVTSMCCVLLCEFCKCSFHFVGCSSLIGSPCKLLLALRDSVLQSHSFETSTDPTKCFIPVAAISLCISISWPSLPVL